MLYPDEWKNDFRKPIEETEIDRVNGKDAFCIGKPVIDIDGVAKVEGRLHFADDIEMDGMLYACPLFARVPHARIRRLDVSDAEKQLGVARVFTAKDVPGLNGVGMAKPDWPVFVNDEVFFLWQSRCTGCCR